MGEDTQIQQLSSGEILCKTQPYIKFNLFSATSSLTVIFLTLCSQADIYTPPVPHFALLPSSLLT